MGCSFPESNAYLWVSAWVGESELWASMASHRDRPNDGRDPCMASVRSESALSHTKNEVPREGNTAAHAGMGCKTERKMSRTVGPACFSKRKLLRTTGPAGDSNRPRARPAGPRHFSNLPELGPAGPKHFSERKAARPLGPARDLNRRRPQPAGPGCFSFCFGPRHAGFWCELLAMDSAHEGAERR